MSHESWDESPDRARGEPWRRPVRHSVLAGLGFATAVAGTALLGRSTMLGKGRPEGMWFRTRRKPSFQPPNWVFGPVWALLYGTIAYSGLRLWRTPPSAGRSRALKLWGAQLALNAAWTPLFFGARRPSVALADLVALDTAASVYAVCAYKVDRRAAIVVGPYLGWLGFATVLNASIVVKNR